VYTRAAVFDRNAPSTKRAVAELLNKDLYDQLLRYALWRTSSDAAAKDLLADAIECVGDPSRKPWDPSKVSFFRHMRLVMDTLAIEGARKGYGRFEVVDSRLAVDATTADPSPLPEEALHDHRELAREKEMGDLLLVDLGDSDPVATKVFRAASEGIEEPREQAAHIGCRVEEVYEALRRLKYRGARIRKSYEAREAARMKEARQSAKKKDKP
jgi:hypothetical protein